MNKYETRLFALLDEYARRRHQCFIAEMFLNREETAYLVCFRPLTRGIESADRFGCRYIEIDAVETKNAGKSATLVTSID
jgi:hypothetical protein